MTEFESFLSTETGKTAIVASELILTLFLLHTIVKLSTNVQECIIAASHVAGFT